MKGMKIGDFHTWKDWGLYLQNISIDYPLRKEHLVSVPGLSGKIDLSQALTDGEVKYENRVLAFSFEFADGGYEEMLTKASIISNAINGKRLKIALDEDPQYYYEGAVQVKVNKINSMVSSLDITVNADPYKYDILSSTDEWLWDSFNFQTGVVSNLKDIQIEDNLIVVPCGGAASTIPIFHVKETSRQITFVHNAKTYSLKEGKNRFPQVKVGSREVSLQFTGAGIIDIEYRRQSQ